MGISRRKNRKIIKKRTKRKNHNGGKPSLITKKTLPEVDQPFLPKEELDKKVLKDTLDKKLQQELVVNPGIITDLKVLKNGLKESKQLIEELYRKFSPIQFNEDNVIAQYICSGTEYATDSSCEGLRYLEQQHCSNKKNIIGELACANLDVIINNVCNKIDVRNNLCKNVKKKEMPGLNNIIKDIKDKGNYLSKLKDSKMAELQKMKDSKMAELQKLKVSKLEKLQKDLKSNKKT